MNLDFFFVAPVVLKWNCLPAFSILTSSSSNSACFPRYSSEVKYINMFTVLQDLRPLYAGRCAYHSSQDDRDVRNTHLTSTFTEQMNSSSMCLHVWIVARSRPKVKRLKYFLTLRWPAIHHRARPVACVWRATPVTAVNSTTAGSEYAERRSETLWISGYSLCCVALIVWIFHVYRCDIFVGDFFALQLLLIVLEQECFFSVNLCFREHPLMGLQNKDVLKKFRKSSMIWK